MTCREKLAIEHPGCVADMYEGGAKGCPDDYGYLSKPNYCGRVDQVCKSCWSREIPEEPKMVYAHIGPFGDLSNAVCKIGEAAVKMGHSIDLVGRPMEDTLLNGERPHILDSGNRTVFESGAVRDIQDGKGRCDLLPLDVVGFYYAHDEDLSDQDSPQTWVFYHLSRFVLDGQIEHLRKALRDSHIFADPETMFLETAIHYEEGAKKYDENNWKKGIPVKRYIDSGVRHYLKFLRGDTDERHDRAFCWNMMGAIWTCKHMPELNEYRKTELGEASDRKVEEG